MKKFKIIVVPHSHWDKEWYFSKQDSDVILVDNLNKFLKLYQSNNDCYSFTYDGQTSIIDDYLSYCQKSDVLTSALKKKKLIVGPWYSQPDFFNSTSESITRNLLLGINIAKSYEADYLKTAYVPDSFGHNSQMPQIYQQFGLNQFIYWRGAREKDVANATVHWWQGIDDSKILAYNFYFGYWVMGMHFPYQSLTENNLEQQAKKFVTSFAAILKILKNKVKNVSDHLLIPLGGDQAPVTLLLKEFIQQVNLVDPENSWEVSDYDSYFANNKFNNLETVSGELKSPAYARIHKTIGSQRADLKVKIKELEYNLFQHLEPLATYYYLCNGTYPTAIVNKVFKNLLTSQAHDSLGGCNSDNTNKDIDTRLDQSNDLVKTSITKILKVLAANNNLLINDFIIFNQNLKKENNNKRYVVNIFTKSKYFNIFDENNAKVNYVIEEQKHLGGGYDVVVKPDGEHSVLREGFYSTKIHFLNLNLKLFDINNFKIVETKEHNLSYQLVVKDNIENQKWKVTINENGTLTIFDKINQINYENQFQLFADHDSGDSYDFSPSWGNDKVFNKLVVSEYQIENNGDFYILHLKNIYEILQHENGKLINQEFTFKFYIYNSDEIKIELSTVNQAYEIRWRIACHVAFLTNKSYANQAYSTIARPVVLKEDLAIWKQNNWKEKPVAIETNESFVYLQENNIKSGFITKGNNEYEIENEDNSTILLTLFRSVPYLGKDNLVYRPGRASGVNELSVATDDAKLLKPLKFEVNWFSSTHENIWDLALKLNAPDIFYQVQKLNMIYHNGDRFLIPEIEKLTLNNNFNLNIDWPTEFSITAIKKSENSNSIIIRGFNNSVNEITINFGQHLSVNSLNLLEENICCNLKEDKIKKYQIKTYEFMIKEC